MRKRKQLVAERVDTSRDGRTVRIKYEYAGMYENLRSPVHITDVPEKHARQLLESLREVFPDD